MASIKNSFISFFSTIAGINQKNRILPFFQISLLISVFFGFNYLLVLFTGAIQVELDVKTSRSNIMRFFWTDTKDDNTGKIFNEQQMVAVPIFADKIHYDFSLPNSFRNVKRIRFDPLSSPDEIEISNFNIKIFGYEDIKPFSRNTDATLKMMHQIARFDHIGENKIILKSGGRFPRIDIILSPKLDKTIFSIFLVTTTLVVILLYFILFSQRNRHKKSGQLVIKFPRQTTISNILSLMSGLKHPIHKESPNLLRQETDFYILICHFSSLDNQAVKTLLNTIKISFNDAQIKIQYDRPGEI